MKCRICENTENNESFLVKEMMYGSQKGFIYFECSDCGCFQILIPPDDQELLYPSDYYAFKTATSRIASFKRLLMLKKDRYILFKRGRIARIIYARYRDVLFEFMGAMKIKGSSSILDVGCGAGNLLCYLCDLGFTNLTGVDPFAQKTSNSAMRILKTSLCDFESDEKFDVIIFNHSFEHIGDQFETLRKVAALLSHTGRCLIRMPVKTEYIWDRYGVDWGQIDAPRHFLIHTEKSFELLTQKAGLVVESATFDSFYYQFVASEQNKKGIPLVSDQSYFANRRNSIFNAQQIRAFNKLSRELNQKRQGDQAVFCIKVSERSNQT